MSNARRIRAKCVDCGSTHIRAQASYGWLCDPCWKKRSDAEKAFAARTGGMLMQPLDPDGPPHQCGCGECRRDAVMCVRVHVGTPNEIAVRGCGKHLPNMMAEAARLAEAQCNGTEVSS